MSESDFDFIVEAPISRQILNVPNFSKVDLAVARSLSISTIVPRKDLKLTVTNFDIPTFIKECSDELNALLDNWNSFSVAPSKRTSCCKPYYWTLCNLL